VPDVEGEWPKIVCRDVETEELAEAIARKFDSDPPLAMP
jgi:hypothetical protein